jgi:hypothetical protein
MTCRISRRLPNNRTEESRFHMAPPDQEIDASKRRLLSARLQTAEDYPPVKAGASSLAEILDAARRQRQ